MFIAQSSSLFLRWSCAVALLGMSGCAAMKASQQPPKRNLNVLSQGTPRTHVIAELGAPIWTDPKSETPIDIYSFKQGYTKGVKATRALAHGAADVATWGLWEVVGIPTETIIDGTDVQLTVYYDEQQQIRTVDVLKGEKAINPPKPFAWARRNPKPKETMPPSESVEQPAPEGTELRIEPPAGKKILAGGADDDVIRR